MTDIMNMFGRLRDALASQLSSYRVKKSDLVEAYYLVGQLDYGCRKLELANMLSAIIISELENEYKYREISELCSDQLKKEISVKLHAKLDYFNLGGLSISKKIQDIFNFEPITHNNNMINNRLVRISQENIDNIWTSQSKAIQCLCPKAPFNLEQTQKVEICYRCEQKYHSDCFWGPQRGEQLFQCPFCYIKFCAPQKEVKQILFGGYLPILKKQKVEYKISFPLDKVKLDKSVYLEARCVKFNRQNRYEISWPDNCSFSIGKIKIAEFKPLQTSSPLKRRADEPIKLDRCRLQNENEIIIQERNTAENNYKLNKKCNHLVVIMVITELPNEMVLSKFEKNELPIAESKDFLTKYMFHEKGDILIEKISISLKCQYYGGKMKLPARSRHCNTHIQPFDLMNFINSSILAKTSTRKWKCPICDKRAYDLVIDKYILTLMQENPSVNQIIFRENGQPQMIQGKQDQNSDLESDHGEKIAEYEKKQKLKANIVIDIDLDDEPQPLFTFEPVLPMISSTANSRQTSNHVKQSMQEHKQQNKSLIVDSEEDYRQKNRRQLKAQKSKNQSKINEELIEPMEIKKIRKLNDGSLELADNVNGRRRKMDTNAIGKILVQLSSDGEDFSNKPVVFNLKEKELLAAVKKTKNIEKNEKGQNKMQKEKVEKPKAIVQKTQATVSKQRQKPEQKERLKSNKVADKEKYKQFLSLEVINIDSDGQTNPKEKENENEMDVIVSKQKRDEILSNMIDDVIHNVDRNGKQPITDEDKDLFESLYSKILEITEDEK